MTYATTLPGVYIHQNYVAPPPLPTVWQMKTFSGYSNVTTTWDEFTHRDVEDLVPVNAYAYSNHEILAGMRGAVARAGGDHVAISHSVRHVDPSGFACIQGELLRELKLEYLGVSAYDGVARQLGRPHDQSLLEALAHAQRLNDNRIPWGEILRRTEHALAA